MTKTFNQNSYVEQFARVVISCLENLVKLSLNLSICHKLTDISCLGKNLDLSGCTLITDVVLLAYIYLYKNV